MVILPVNKLTFIHTLSMRCGCFFVYKGKSEIMDNWEEWKDNYIIEEKNVFTVSHPGEASTKYFDTQEEAQSYVDYMVETIKKFFEEWPKL